MEQLLEPPEEHSILAATKRLQDLGALDEKDVSFLHRCPLHVLKSCSVKLVHAVTSIEKSPLSCPSLGNFICIEPKVTS